MNCTAAKKLIYLEAELNETEKSDLQNHLGKCADCRALYASASVMRTSISILAESEHAAVDSSRLTDKVMSHIQEKKKPAAWSLLPGTWLRLGLSGISMILVVGFFLEFNQSPDLESREFQNSSIVRHTGGANVLRQTEKRASLLAVAEARKQLIK